MGKSLRIVPFGKILKEFAFGGKSSGFFLSVEFLRESSFGDILKDTFKDFLQQLAKSHHGIPGRISGFLWRQECNQWKLSKRTPLQESAVCGAPP